MWEYDKHGAAFYDHSRRYRYLLERWWDGGERTVVFIGLNPSTATASEDDPTVRRCIGFAKRWGFRRLKLLNLFALRATDPKELRRAEEPFGPENAEQIGPLCVPPRLVVAAWGNHGELRNRGQTVAQNLDAAGVNLNCFGLTTAGHPKHPLYLPYDAELVQWKA